MKKPTKDQIIRKLSGAAEKLHRHLIGRDPHAQVIIDGKKYRKLDDYELLANGDMPLNVDDDGAVRHVFREIKEGDKWAGVPVTYILHDHAFSVRRKSMTGVYRWVDAER